ncbi:MAG TPA: flagellar basal body rod protein FlgB [Phycisphaerae bacterium]|nr:flagellar basal body rod protein FlgB [Phycisphaerae bacterium]
MDVPNLTDSGPIPLLEKTLAFAEARQRMLATNIANITTPGYRAMQLDEGAFQGALAEAAKKREETGGAFELEATREFRVDRQGLLGVTPSENPAENLLFQDGTNASIERQMAQLAENAMLNQVSAELLKGYFDGLAKAIRGRVS